MYARTQDRDQPTTWTTRQAQYDAVCAWGIPDNALLQRPSAISQPVFVVNGDSDPMILPHYSYLLAGLIPPAQVRIYPDSANGFLFQHHTKFAADVEASSATARCRSSSRRKAAAASASPESAERPVRGGTDSRNDDRVCRPYRQGYGCALGHVGGHAM
jgi:hypothetical protein